MERYRLKVPIPAIHDMREDRDVRVTLPSGAMLMESPQHSTTLMGMVGVYWGRAALFGPSQRPVQESRACFNGVTLAAAQKLALLEPDSVSFLRSSRLSGARIALIAPVLLQTQ